jgi:hypothetical protein
MSFARFTAALASAAALGAMACGVCIDDKVAATWDNAVVERAIARHQVVVFAEAHSGAEASGAARSLRVAASRVRGIERASVRAAAQPLTLSFALDPKLVTPREALESVRRKAAIPQLELTLLRVQQ